MSVGRSRPTGRERRKIVFVNRYFHPDQSATSQLLTDLASALAEKKFDVHVVCCRQRYDDPDARLPSRESVGGVKVYRLWTTRFGRSGLFGRAIDYATFYAVSTIILIGAVRRGDTVIAQTDPPLVSIPAMVVTKLKGAVLVNWLQDIFAEVASRLGMNPLPAGLDAWLRRCRDLSLRSARVNVVIGARMRQRLLDSRVDAERILVVQNWAEREPAPPKPVRDSILRRRLGFVDQFVVAYSGNLGRAHEFDTLLGAAERLRDDPGIVFLMIGGGTGMVELAKAVERGGLTSFRFMPYQPRAALGDALAAADAHWVSLLPSLEGLIVPSKFYGILAAARPVIFIGDADGELAREIRACDCGDTVTIGASEALANLLRAWRSHPARHAEMGWNGYRRYQTRYSAGRAFEQWAGLLTPPGRAVGASAPSSSNQ